MSYERELLEDARGPVSLELDGNAINFRVVMQRRSGILVEMSTDGRKGSEEAKLIERATLKPTRNGYKLVVPVPDSVSILNGRAASFTQSVINSTSGRSVVQYASGNVQVNSFGRSGGQMLVLNYGIDVTVYLPEDSDILCARGGDLKIVGRSGLIEAKLFGGDVLFTEARELKVRTAGGNIEGEFVANRAQAKTSGGDIRIGVTRGEADLETSGGNVTIGEAYWSGRMRTSGGDVKLGSFYGETMIMQTSGGDIRHPEHPGVRARTTGGQINGKRAAW